MYIGREGAGEASGFWGALMVGRNEPGLKGDEDMIILASGCVFSKKKKKKRYFMASS
jgi:hypothetical protein